MTATARINSQAQAPRAIFTVRQFAERNPAFTENALRNMIFKAGARNTSRGEIPGNGLLKAGAIVRIGRKVLIDEAAFFVWFDSLNSTASNHQSNKGTKNVISK